MRVTCPMCGGRTRIVRSALITAFTRRGDCVCQNPDCGWTGTATMTIERTKSPGLLATASASAATPRNNNGGSHVDLPADGRRRLDGWLL